MGNSTSKNVTKETIDSMISVFTNAASTSYATCEGINLATLKGCTIKGDFSLEQSNFCNFDVEAFTKNASSETIKNDLKNIAKQKSESVSQILQLSSSDSKNVYDAMLHLGTSIQNSATTSVTTQSINQNALNCDSTTFEKSVYIDQNNITTTLQKLVTSNQSVIDAQQKLESTIDQYSKSSVSGFGFFMIFLIVALVVLSPVLIGTSAISSMMPFIIGICTILATLYTVRDCFSKEKVVCKKPMIYYIGSLLSVSFLMMVIMIYRKK